MCRPEFTRQLPLKTAQFYAISHECEGATGKQIPVIHEKWLLARQTNKCRLLLQTGAEPSFSLMATYYLLIFIEFVILYRLHPGTERVGIPYTHNPDVLPQRYSNLLSHS
jgi:hypothetical protein